jgi:hypothetical protein
MRANTIGLIAGTIAVASSANAGLVIGDIISVSRQSGDGHLVTANYDGSRASNASGVTGGQLARAGSMVFNYNSVNGTAVGGQFVSFCVELGEGFPDDPISYTIVAPTQVPEEDPPGNMTANQSQMMQDLYSRYYSDVITDNGETWSNYLDEMTAFQLVIWEISHENFSDTSDLSIMKSELSITLGAMAVTDYYSADVLNSANVMIAALGTGGWNSMSNLLGGTNATNQDLLIVVPSPAIAGLAGLGLVGMRRRRR